MTTATSFCSPAWMRASIWSNVPPGEAAGSRFLAQLALAKFADFARPGFALHRNEGLARAGHAGKAQNLNRGGRSGGCHRAPLVIQHGADSPPFGSGHANIALMQRAPLNQHRGNRAAAAIEP